MHLYCSCRDVRFCNYILFDCIALRLTNEESRKNWEEHGNPDGPQGALLLIYTLDYHTAQYFVVPFYVANVDLISCLLTSPCFSATTFGIALPSWIVSEENSLLVKLNVHC